MLYAGKSFLPAVSSGISNEELGLIVRMIAGVTDEEAGLLAIGGTAKTLYEILKAESDAIERRVMKEVERREREQKRREDQPTGTQFRKPTVEEVAEFCRERGNGIDAEEFCAYYDSVGWVIGRNRPMRNWRAAIGTWEKKRGFVKTPKRKSFDEVYAEKVREFRERRKSDGH